MPYEWIGLAAAAVLLLSGPRADAADLAVSFVNRSVETRCAEEDNVSVSLVSASVRHFRLEALHPPYVDAIEQDRIAPDFTSCGELRDEGPELGEPERFVLAESETWRLVAHRLDTFWRPHRVPILVDGRIYDGEYLLQLWARLGNREEEVLAIYPSDGYWRARPLPPEHLESSAYGSSVLIGPLEQDTRPFVDLRLLAFDPTSGRFTLYFGRGGIATVAVEGFSRESIAIQVTLDESVPRHHPLAAVRSMWVSDDNADVSRLRWRHRDGAWWEAPILDVPYGEAVELWLGRPAPSRHNTSAPDLRFGSFR